MMQAQYSEVSIENVQVQHDGVAALVHLIQRGVFMIAVSSSKGDLVHKRFVQLETGVNNLKLPIGMLSKGNYMLTLLKGDHTIKKTFSC